MNWWGRGESKRDDVTLNDRVEALERALDQADQHLDLTRTATAREVLAKVKSRMGHGSENTVIALAGSTGVGKSSLFNALVGEDVSDVGVRRPTTGVAHAAVWGDPGDGATDSLLDWLSIGRRHHVAHSGSPDVDQTQRAGLVLVDLPDFDSTEADNRVEVDRLIKLVDAMIWVTDPQKYADEAFHDGYIRRLVDHQRVLYFVINKIDTVRSDEREALVADFANRLREDGIDSPQVRVVSVASDDGVDAVDKLLLATVDERQVVVERLVADLRAAAGELVPAGSTEGVSKAARREMIERLGHAAGADQVGEIVAAQHRKDARMAIGWPVLRLTERLRRRHPISELPRASASTVARSEIDTALRNLAESTASDLGAPWPPALRETAARRGDDLASRLTATTQATAREATARPRWWTPIAWLQRAALAAAVAGALWLLVVAALGGFLQFDTEPLLIETPRFEWMPVPSAMVLGGLLLGALLALIIRIPVAAAAKRRGMRVRGQMLDRIGEVVDETVIADLDRVLEARTAIVADLTVATA